MAGESNDREKEEEMLSTGLAAEGGSFYILQQKTLLTT